MQTASTSPPSPKKLNVQPSEHLTQWLQETNLSIGFTTYQTNRLFLLGHQANGRLALNERLFDKPMCLFADGQRLLMSTRYQIWELENRLATGESYQGGDRLYVPAQSHTTGDINVHDLVLDAQQRLVFVNTDFSCLATLRPGYSFEPIWQPSFITKLAAEDRCHLNGLALQDGEPTYVTACSTTDESSGWRNHKIDGGVVIHVPSNEIITKGLSMPHSPRWYQGKLWLLNSGTGELGYLDDNQFQPVIFCPGFVRGLAFWKNFAVVGLSKLRSKSFSGLPLTTRLADQGLAPQ
ncbi:MAG: TIGR03032 family protein, partial [Leptolyngbyaceae cyanobacterium]